MVLTASDRLLLTIGLGLYVLRRRRRPCVSNTKSKSRGGNLSATLTDSSQDSDITHAEHLTVAQRIDAVRCEWMHPGSSPTGYLAAEHTDITFDDPITLYALSQYCHCDVRSCSHSSRVIETLCDIPDPKIAEDKAARFIAYVVGQIVKCAERHDVTSFDRMMGGIYKLNDLNSIPSTSFPSASYLAVHVLLAGIEGIVVGINRCSAPDSLLGTPSISTTSIECMHILGGTFKASLHCIETLHGSVPEHRREDVRQSICERLVGLYEACAAQPLSRQLVMQLLQDTFALGAAPPSATSTSTNTGTTRRGHL